MNQSDVNQIRIYRLLRADIDSGVYPENSALPSLRQLAVQFDSSPGTVRQALLKLQQEGDINAVHGVGYFVNSRSQRKNRHILLVERGGNRHLYSNFLNEFQNCFLQSPEYLISVEDLLKYNECPELLQERLLNCNNEKIEAVFFDGEQIPIYTRETYERLKQQLNLFYYFNAKSSFIQAGIPGVATDWNHGLYIAVRHLLEIGCRNILLQMSLVRRDGALAALHDLGGNARLTFTVTSQEFEEKIASEDFDGLYCFQDYLAVETIQVLRERGYKIPGDIAVVGYFNTPWSEYPNCPLTSVSICEDEIVRKVFDMFKGVEKPSQLTQMPRLVIRDSTTEFNK